MELAGQLIGIASLILTFLSYQAKGAKRLLVLQTTSTVGFIIHYILIGAISGFALNIVCVVRNIIYCNKDKKRFYNEKYPYILSGIILLLGVMSWQGAVSLFLIVALALNTVFLSNDDVLLLRKSVIFTSSLIFIYNLLVCSYGGMMNEALAVISSVIALYRYKTNKA